MVEKSGHTFLQVIKTNCKLFIGQNEIHKPIKSKQLLHHFQIYIGNVVELHGILPMTTRLC